MFKLVYSENYKFVYSDMVKQFPVDELKSYQDFVDKFSKDYCLYEFYDNELLVGYVVLFIDSEYLFIDYIAIFKEFHSKGYGTKILKTLKDMFEFQKEGCFFEVEKEVESSPNTIKRVNFYKKNGAVCLNINYLYPNRDGYLPMDLYYIPYNEQLPQLSKIKAFVNNLFNKVHFDIEHKEEVFDKIFG